VRPAPVHSRSVSIGGKGGASHDGSSNGRTAISAVLSSQGEGLPAASSGGAGEGKAPGNDGDASAASDQQRDEDELLIGGKGGASHDGSSNGRTAISAVLSSQGEGLQKPTAAPAASSGGAGEGKAPGNDGDASAASDQQRDGPLEPRRRTTEASLTISKSWSKTSISTTSSVSVPGSSTDCSSCCLVRWSRRGQGARK
jgi:hypothetical protein